jgi:hypothetical protein
MHFVLELVCVFFMTPYVQAKRATTAGRQARVWWPAVVAPLERGVRPQLDQGGAHLHLEGDSLTSQSAVEDQLLSDHS